VSRDPPKQRRNYRNRLSDGSADRRKKEQLNTPATYFLGKHRVLHSKAMSRAVLDRHLRTQRRSRKPLCRGTKSVEGPQGQYGASKVITRAYFRYAGVGPRSRKGSYGVPTRRGFRLKEKGLHWQPRARGHILHLGPRGHVHWKKDGGLRSANKTERKTTNHTAPRNNVLTNLGTLLGGLKQKPLEWMLTGPKQQRQEH